MASTAAKKIGWIDDELDARSAEARFLALEGFEPIFASTATDGLALVRSRELSLLLLDLCLPDLDGLSVLATLRREGVCIPVLILTGFGDFDAARRAGGLGAVGFEAKPIFAERLVELVKKFATTTAGPGLDAPPVNRRLGHMQQLLTDISAIAAGQ
jgi:two-component system, response regulator FlrC